MLRAGTLLLALSLFILPPLSRAAAADANDGPTDLTIAVTDFVGNDRDSGRLITDTLLTDLAQSDQLHIVERAEFRRALSELNLSTDSLYEPSEVRRIGRRLDADRILVGSSFVHDDHITLNARLLDVHTGRIVPGGAASVSGDRSDVSGLTHRLARLIYRRATGSDLVLDEDKDQAGSTDPSDPKDQADTRRPPSAEEYPPLQDDPTPAPRHASSSQELDTLRESGLIPANAHPGGLVRERELASLVTRVARRLHSESHAVVAVSQPVLPVSRLRALVALVKAAVSPEEIASYRKSPPEDPLPEEASIPLWAKPYVAAAVDQGWWPYERPLQAREPATWSFVADVMAQMPLDEEPAPEPAPRHSAPPPPQEPEEENFTGLIVDARSFGLQRQMGPRILDEDGQVLYPDQNHIPDYDYLQDKGMVDYTLSTDDAQRAGKHPLIVSALDVVGPGHDDLVVSNTTARRIRAANRRGKFFSNWSVCIVTDAHP